MIAAVSTNQSPHHQKLLLLARDIKLSHSVFAMPWAILAAFLAARGMPRLVDLVLLVLCMVTARTVAMLANRLLDADLDAVNPRTAGRALPSGRVDWTFALVTLIATAIAFIAATSGFWFADRNAWPIALSIPVLLFLSGYPLLKRFTRLCHYYLGAALALAPVCAWLAIRGDLTVTPFLMAGAVVCWTAGFDIIYACQDYESDIATGVFSVPATVGISRALWISRLTHFFCIAFMILSGESARPQLGTLYDAGVTIATVLIILEQSLVSPSDLSKVGLAFFTLNGLISLLIGTLGSIDVFMHTH
ncbi:MAG: UbiA family prenyltransferase [Phycisphaerae bacterium]|nr:UbiA family prenyltransferase [Phycisphaerae bacterium]